MKLFEVQRKMFDEKINVYCIALIAEGVQFSNGTCVVMWRGKVQSTVVYDSMSDLKEVMCSNPLMETHVVMLNVKCNCSVDSDLESDYEDEPGKDEYVL